MQRAYDEIVDHGRITLAKGCEYSMNCYETKLNNNVLVVGASGCGKTTSIVSPNIRRCYGSYVISDPKGNLYEKHKDWLEDNGYVVIKLDLTHPEKSAHYNPFAYIQSYDDVKRMAHSIVFGSGEMSYTEPFWPRSAEGLLTALIGYVWSEALECEQNMQMVYEMLSRMTIPPEEDMDYRSEIDLLFDELEATGRQPAICYAYKNVRYIASRTIMCIKAEVNSVIGCFDSPNLNRLLSYDEIALDKIGSRKTAVFVAVSDTDRSMDTLANMFFSQAIRELCRVADDVYGGKLPIAVQFILDDFATNVKIADFPRMISSFRSRAISSMIIVQAENQLRSLFGYDAETIIANCDSYVYLGGSDIETARNIATRSGTAIRKTLYMPIGGVWVFRRGSKPRYSRQNKEVY